MLISLHKQATTTPKIRAAIQASAEAARVVAERYGISEQTVWKWRNRDSVHDRSHTAHRLQTTLTPARGRRWVFVRIYPTKSAANARRFLRDLERAAPMRITRILTDNGKEFTDRLSGLRRRAPTGNHDFDRLCTDLGIEHRLAPPMHPQTNGMVERFNGRIEDVLQSHRFCSGEDLEQTILRYVWLYNGQLPQSVLKGRTPIDALKDWQKQKPDLFKKRPYNHAGCDTYRTIFQLAQQMNDHLTPESLGNDYEL